MDLITIACEKLMYSTILHLSGIFAEFKYLCT